MIRAVPAALHPDKLTEALEEMQGQIPNSPEEDQQRLKNLATGLKLDLSRYILSHEKGCEKISQIEGQKPKEFAETKAYEQLQASLEGHKEHIKDKSLDQQHIKAANKERFDFLHKQGFPTAKNAEDFHKMKARDELLLSEKEPVFIPKPPNTAKKLFLSSMKIAVGCMTAISLDMLFNPDHYAIATGIALFIGIGFSLIMLTLVEVSAYLAKFSKHPKKYIAALIILTSIYMLAEAWINYEGIISVSRQMAIQSMTEGMLLEAGEEPNISAPAHYSIMFLTLCLVGFAALYSAFIGWCKAHTAVKERDLEISLAQLRKDNTKLMQDSAIIDEPEFREGMKGKVQQKISQKPLTKWQNNAVQQLAKAEDNIEKNAAQIGQELAKEGERIRVGILALGNEIYKSQRGPASFWKKPLKLLKLVD